MKITHCFIRNKDLDSGQWKDTFKYASAIKGRYSHKLNFWNSCIRKWIIPCLQCIVYIIYAFLQILLWVVRTKQLVILKTVFVLCINNIWLQETKSSLISRHNICCYPTLYPYQSLFHQTNWYIKSSPIFTPKSCYILLFKALPAHHCSREIKLLAHQK